MTRLPVALLVGVLLAGCASGADVHLLSDDDLPEDLYASPSPTPDSEPVREVTLYFVRGPELAPVVRTVSGSADVLERALRELLAGPLPEEVAQGITTAIPDGVSLLAVEVDEGIASVNLSREFELSAEQYLLILRVGQIVQTAASFSTVSEVEFLTAGEPLLVLAQDGQVRGEPVRRGDYAQLLPGAQPTETPVSPDPGD